MLSFQEGESVLEAIHIVECHTLDRGRLAADHLQEVPRELPWTDEFRVQVVDVEAGIKGSILAEAVTCQGSLALADAMDGLLVFIGGDHQGFFVVCASGSEKS